MDTAERHRLLTRLDALAPVLVERAAPVRFAIASSRAQREAVWRLRATAVIEHGWMAPDAFPDGMERDRFDDCAELVAGWDGDTLVATARLVFPTPGKPLPTEDAFGVVAQPRGQVVNLDRLTVARASSDASHRVLIGLVARCWQELRARGYHLWIGVDTPGMIRLYRRLGWHVTPLGPARPYWGAERIPCRFDPVGGITPPPDPDSPQGEAADLKP
jgi:N-acyl-L-homoserine lactone synthetase